MAIELEAFGDESGIESNAHYCVLLGYIGTPAEWESFNIAWDAVLSKDGIQEFHAIEFFPPKRRLSHENPYKDWSKEHRFEYLTDLLSVIANHRIIPVGWAVDVNAFHALKEAERRYLTSAYLETSFHGKSLNKHGGNPFKLSFQRKLTTSGAKSRPYMVVFGRFFHDVLLVSPPDSLIHVLLDNNQLEPIATETFYRVWKRRHPGGKWFDSITFADSTTRPQLQAADLLAYVWHRHITQETDSDEVRYAMQSLTIKKRYLRVANAKYFERELKKLYQDLQSETLPWLSQPENEIETHHTSEDVKS